MICAGGQEDRQSKPGIHVRRGAWCGTKRKRRRPYKKSSRPELVGRFEGAQTGNGCETPPIGLGDLGVALSTGNTVEEMFHPQQVTGSSRKSKAVAITMQRKSGAGRTADTTVQLFEQQNTLHTRKRWSSPWRLLAVGKGSWTTGARLFARPYRQQVPPFVNPTKVSTSS